MKFSLLIAGACIALSTWGATFGRVVPLIGGASDLVLDESRGRVYLTASVQNQIQIYSVAKQSFQTPVSTDQTPLAAVLSRDGKSLYVACYDSSTLDVIDPDALVITARISLPAKPEAVAVGNDGRVLISTVGSNGTVNVLLLYDPSPGAGTVLRSLSVTPAAPAAPTFPAPSSRPFLSRHSQLVASRNGGAIAGIHVPTIGAASVFYYETASNTVLRSRVLAGPTTSLAISDDGTRIASGAILFDSATLQVLGQQNVANVPYPVTPGTTFTAQTLHGGSVFSPDGQTLYSAFNIAPVGSLTASQLMLNDPDNLLVHMGLQLPESLAGRMVVSADGANIYALSDSGMVIVPVGTISQNPLAVPATDVVLLTRDSCGVTAANSSVTINVNNPGKGRATVIAQLLQFAGATGQAAPATAPTVRATPGTASTQLAFTYNAAAPRTPGTINPPHDFIITSPEAINIPDRVRVYQNNRDSDARGTVIPIQGGNSTGETFPDLVYDASRQRVYIVNSGLNRIEIYDIRQQKLLAPIKVGQLPSSMALTPDGFTLFVSNSGGETISIVDPDQMLAVDHVVFPQIAFNAALAIATPGVLASSFRGPQFLMSNGSLWSVDGNAAVPRGISKLIGQTAQGSPTPIPLPSVMASTPGGEFILLVTSTGFAYLYDATADDFVATRQVFTPAAQTGYIGPVTAGPKGQYYVVNGTALNQALEPSAARATVGLVSAVAAVGNTTFAIFSPPTVAANATPVVQILDAVTGIASTQVSGLEDPVIAVAGTARANISGRTMAVDASGTNAYVITVSGLSIVPLAPVLPADRPQPFTRGAVNLASYQTAVAANGLLSIFGQNFGSGDVASGTPLPLILGGTCVTLNNIALPLFMVTPAQINAQIPPGTAVGSYPLVVRSIAKQAASSSQQLAISAAAPAVLVDSTGQLALFHADGKYVNQDHPATRDEPLVMYAVGLGPTTGGAVSAGAASPASPLAVTGAVKVFFGDPTWVQAPVIVDWSGLAPGFVGLYQLNLRIPGFHINGDHLLVTVQVGNAVSPSSGPVVPYVSTD